VIEKIVIKDTDSAEGYDKLAISIRENRKNNIKHIDLSDNRILCGDYNTLLTSPALKEKGMLSLATGLDSMIHGLKTLDLSYCSINEKGIVALMTVFQV
jgi:hypothetical protein